MSSEAITMKNMAVGHVHAIQSMSGPPLVTTRPLVGRGAAIRQLCGALYDSIPVERSGGAQVVTNRRAGGRPGDGRGGFALIPRLMRQRDPHHTLPRAKPLAM
jgi:hypothetical protein